jgi:hypothetical protein
MEIEINMTCVTDHCPKCKSSVEWTEDIGDVEIPDVIEIPFECTCGHSFVSKIRLTKEE